MNGRISLNRYSLELYASLGKGVNGSASRGAIYRLRVGRVHYRRKNNRVCWRKRVADKEVDRWASVI